MFFALSNSKQSTSSNNLINNTNTVIQENKDMNNANTRSLPLNTSIFCIKRRSSGYNRRHINIPNKYTSNINSCFRV